MQKSWFGGQVVGRLTPLQWLPTQLWSLLSIKEFRRSL
jgi:hypothetical protein